jgi:UDP-glucose 4,6-dehydratase
MPASDLVPNTTTPSGSHVVLLLVKKYPQYKIVNLDRLDCALVGWSVDWLVDRSAAICTHLHQLSQPTQSPADCSCTENLAEVERFRNYRFIKGDIRSADLVNFVLEEEQIDTILHFAAQTHVDNSFGNSFLFTQNNVLGTHVLLESAKKFGVKRFIHVSTDEVYGEGAEDQPPMFEDQVLEPTNPYAATKVSAIVLIHYHHSIDLALTHPPHPTISPTGGRRVHRQELLPVSFTNH